MAADPTNSERQRRWRERQAGRLGDVPVCSCGKLILRSANDGLCSRCWRKTPEGREQRRLAVAAIRAKRRQA